MTRHPRRFRVATQRIFRRRVHRQLPQIHHLFHLLVDPQKCRHINYQPALLGLRRTAQVQRSQRSHSAKRRRKHRLKCHQQDRLIDHQSHRKSHLLFHLKNRHRLILSYHREWNQISHPISLPWCLRRDRRILISMTMILISFL